MRIKPHHTHVVVGHTGDEPETVIYATADEGAAYVMAAHLMRCREPGENTAYAVLPADGYQND